MRSFLANQNAVQSQINEPLTRVKTVGFVTTPVRSQSAFLMMSERLHENAIMLTAAALLWLLYGDGGQTAHTGTSDPSVSPYSATVE